MLLGRVVGTVVASRKEPSLEGLKFLVLKLLDVPGALLQLLEPLHPGGDCTDLLLDRCRPHFDLVAEDGARVLDGRLRGFGFVPEIDDVLLQLGAAPQAVALVP